MPAEQKSELAFLPLQADRSERPGVPGLTAKKVASFDKNASLKILYLKIGVITGKGYNLLPIKLCLHAWSVQANY